MGHISIAGDKIYTYAVKQINTCHASTFSITDYYPFPRDHVKANSISKDDCVPNLIVTLKYTTMKNYLEPYKSTAICVNISIYIFITPALFYVCYVGIQLRALSSLSVI